MREIYISKKEKINNIGILIDENVSKKLSNYKMINNFGIKSKHYKWTIYKLNEIYAKLEKKNNQYLQEVTNKWKKIFSKIYGDPLNIDFFLNHVYLAIIVKIILNIKFYSQKHEPVDELIYLYSFDKNSNNNEIGIFLTEWLKIKDIVNDSLSIFQKTKEELSYYNLTNIDDDIFRGLYEEIIEQTHRQKLGEYYTPKWLVELVLEETLSEWNNNNPPKILDPACGSGTFLIYSIFYIKKRYNITSNKILEFIAGFDINPIAEMITKANIALILNEPQTSQFQIYFRDALIDYDLFNYNPVKKYDLIIGNPPWIVLRSIKNKAYQNFIKKEMRKYHLLNKNDVHLHTQLDISTLFFNKCVDKYLHRDGIIGFVMPRSVIGSTQQHKNFKKFEYPQVKLLKIIDIEEVSPLFNMPACVLIGKKGRKNNYPVPLNKYYGTLPSRDISLKEAKSVLSIIKKDFTPKINGENKSYYYDKFKVGLSIFPRSFYFVDLKNIKEKTVSVITSREIYKIVKEPWIHELTGEVEKDFIYVTLLPWKMVPFGYIEMNTVVLPIIPKNDKYILLDLKDMIRLGYIGLYKWFNNAQKIWDNFKTDKAKERFPRLIDRFNYNNLIEFQYPLNKYSVLYNATGKDITSCVIDKHNLPKFVANNLTLIPKGFVPDVKTWVFETNSQNEAYYLSAILNSTLLSKLIKPFQPRGLYGARAIHRRPLEFPIPAFDINNSLHLQLVSFGRNLHAFVKDMIQRKMKKSQIRKNLINEISKIDEAVGIILQQRR